MFSILRMRMISKLLIWNWNAMPICLFTHFLSKKGTPPIHQRRCSSCGVGNNHHSLKHPRVLLTACLSSSILLMWRLSLCLEALLHSRGDSSEVAVDLGRRATQNEGNNGGTCHVNVLESCRDSQRDAARYNVSISTYHPRCESSNLRVPRGSCLRSQ